MPKHDETSSTDEHVASRRSGPPQFAQWRKDDSGCRIVNTMNTEDLEVLAKAVAETKHKILRDVLIGLLVSPLADKPVQRHRRRLTGAWCHWIFGPLTFFGELA
jgi:hypothetical protein